MDDGFEAKVWGLETLRSKIPLFERFYQEVAELYPRASAKLQFNETLKRILDHLIGELMQNSLAAIEREGISSLEQVRGYPRRLIGFSPEAEAQKNVIKKFLYQNLYLHPSFLPEKEQGTQMVQDLFRFYLEHPERMPRWYAEQTAREPKHRVVCDYIAGMTDHYIRKLYQQLLPGAVSQSRG